MSTEPESPCEVLGRENQKRMVALVPDMLDICEQIDTVPAFALSPKLRALASDLRAHAQDIVTRWGIALALLCLTSCAAADALRSLSLSASVPVRGHDVAATYGDGRIGVSFDTKRKSSKNPVMP